MKAQVVILMVIGILLIAVSTQAQDAGAEDPVQRTIDAFYAAQGGDSEVEMLHELGESLSGTQDPRLLEVLGWSLESDDPEIRKAALMSIRSGTAPDPTIVDGALLDQVALMAEDEIDPQAQMAALEILSRDEAFAPEAQPLLEQLAEEQDALAQDADPEDPVQRVIDAFYAAQGGDSEVEMLHGLGESLSGTQDPRLLEVLGSSLESDDPEIRKAALMSIRSGTAPDPTIVDGALLDQIALMAKEEAGTQVQMAALEILSRDEAFASEAQPLLEQLAEEQDALAQDADPEDPVQRSIDAFYDAQGGENEVELVHGLGESLSGTQDPRYLEILGWSLESDDPEIRKAALMSIRSGTAPDPTMLDAALLDQVGLMAEEQETDAAALDAAYDILDSVNKAEQGGEFFPEENAAEWSVNKDDGATPAEVEQRDVQPGDEEAAPIYETEIDQ